MYELLINNLILAIMLAFVSGTIVGKFKYKSFSLGVTSGIMLMSMIIGSIGKFDIPLELANGFLDICIFIIAYEGAPAFKGVLRKSGIKIGVLSLFFCALIVGFLIIGLKLFNIDYITATGLFSGSLTETAVLELSMDILNTSRLSVVEVDDIINKINSAYSLTYIFGTLGITILLKDITPKLLGVDLKDKMVKETKENDIKENMEEDLKVKENKTDVIFLSSGILISLVLGLISFKINDISITISNTGDMALVGLLFGWYRNKKMKREPIPKSVRKVLRDIGISMFLCIIGLRIGNEFLPALRSMGISILLIGFIIPILTYMLTIYFGRYILKLNIFQIIGSTSGIGTVTAAVVEILEENESCELKVTYGITYILGCIFLNTFGQILLLLAIK